MIVELRVRGGYARFKGLDDAVIVARCELAGDFIIWIIVVMS
jgi:hypothetical protein